MERSRSTNDSSNPGNWVRVSVTGPSFSFWWFADFSAANGAPLAPGSYGSVQQYRTTTKHGLGVTGSGRGCGIVRGRFVVREIVLGPSGTISAFAADFEQHCNDAAPALFGAVRYNSSVSDLLPFAGNYPIYQLTIAQDAHGRVTGTGIDCGAGGSTCQSVLPSASQVTITAAPEPGYVFIGWSGDCQGLATTTVHVNSREDVHRALRAARLVIATHDAVLGERGRRLHRSRPRGVALLAEQRLAGAVR